MAAPAVAAAPMYAQPQHKSHSTRNAFMGGLAGAGVGLLAADLIEGHHHDDQTVVVDNNYYGDPNNDGNWDNGGYDDNNGNWDDGNYDGGNDWN